MICNECYLKTEVFQLLVADWDENLGPKLIGHGGNLLFGIELDELQSLVENLFMTFVGIYGSEMNLNEPSHVILPVKYFHSMSLEVFLYFDAKKDESLRNGQLMTMIAFLTKRICRDFENNYLDIFKSVFRAHNEKSFGLLGKISNEMKKYHNEKKLTFSNPNNCRLSRETIL
jgi:hypothetical protein